MNRGRGNYRRGRGRNFPRRWGSAGRGRAGRHLPEPPTQEEQENKEWDITDIETNAADYDIEKAADLTAIFSADASFDQHYKAQEKNTLRYLAALTVLDKNGADIAQSARARSLAAAWARCDSVTSDKLLKKKNLYGLPEVLKAVLLLDARRRCNQLERKLEMWQCSKTKVRPRKVGKLKSEIDSLKILSVKNGSLTKRVCRQVAAWVGQHTEEELEYFALHLPREPWKKLADLCHLHPHKDFPAADWFLAYCFGSPAPDGSMVQTCSTISAANANDVIKEFNVPYSHIRHHVNHTDLTEISKAKIASYTSLDLILWYYEELVCPSVDQQILKRLEKGHKITLPLGKLLERLLAIKLIREGIGSSNVEYDWDERTETLSEKKRNKTATEDPVYCKIAAICQERLKNVVVPIEGPVAVLGDKSGSMDIAIRSSTLLACILSSITSASLVFFDNKAEETAIDPTDILQVLQLAVSIKAQNSTAPAAALYHFYEKKQVIKTFIIATDEEENTAYKNYYFSELYRKYCAQVHPARLVFVSFLKYQHSPGLMVDRLVKDGFKPLQFRFNLHKPDLTKFDKLLGFLSTKDSSFEEQLEEATATLMGDGVPQGTGPEPKASDPQERASSTSGQPEGASSTSGQQGSTTGPEGATGEEGSSKDTAPGSDTTGTADDWVVL